MSIPNRCRHLRIREVPFVPATIRISIGASIPFRHVIFCHRSSSRPQRRLQAEFSRVLADPNIISKGLAPLGAFPQGVAVLPVSSGFRSIGPSRRSGQRASRCTSTLPAAESRSVCSTLPTDSFGRRMVRRVLRTLQDSKSFADGSIAAIAVRVGASPATGNLPDFAPMVPHELVIA